MAYNSNNLSVLAYANRFTLWHYTTPDTMAGVISPGYFDHARDMIQTGDMILINADTATVYPSSGVFCVPPIGAISGVYVVAATSYPEAQDAAA